MQRASVYLRVSWLIFSLAGCCYMMGPIGTHERSIPFLSCFSLSVHLPLFFFHHHSLVLPSEREKPRTLLGKKYPGKYAQDHLLQKPRDESESFSHYSFGLPSSIFFFFLLPREFLCIKKGAVRACGFSSSSPSTQKTPTPQKRGT